MTWTIRQPADVAELFGVWKTHLFGIQSVLGRDRNGGVFQTDKHPHTHTQSTHYIHRDKQMAAQKALAATEGVQINQEQ